VDFPEAISSICDSASIESTEVTKTLFVGCFGPTRRRKLSPQSLTLFGRTGALGLPDQEG
jgi:hypothetical protein